MPWSKPAMRQALKVAGDMREFPKDKEPAAMVNRSYREHWGTPKVGLMETDQ